MKEKHGTETRRLGELNVSAVGLGCIGMSLWRPRLGDLFLEAGRDAKKESPVQRLLPPRLLPGERPRHHERLDSLGYFYEDETKSGLSFLGLKRR